MMAHSSAERRIATDWARAAWAGSLWMLPAFFLVVLGSVLAGVLLAPIFRSLSPPAAPYLTTTLVTGPLGAFFAAVFRRMRIDAGPDGIALSSWGRTRFIAYGEIERWEILVDDDQNVGRLKAVSPGEPFSVLRLTLRGEKKVALRPGYFGRYAPRHFVHGAALTERLRIGRPSAGAHAMHHLGVRYTR